MTSFETDVKNHEDMDDDETEDLNEMNETEMTAHRESVIKIKSTNIKVRTMSV